MAFAADNLKGLATKDFLESESDIGRKVELQNVRMEALTDPAKYYGKRNALLKAGVAPAQVFGVAVVNQLRAQAKLSQRETEKIALAAVNAVFDIWEETVNQVFPETSEMEGKIKLGSSVTDTAAAKTAVGTYDGTIKTT